MLEVGRRRRNLPAPPHVVFEALTQPDRDPARPWLNLRHGETRPRVVRSEEPDLVVWSSLWTTRPDASIRFDLPPGGQGTDLCWTLFLDEPVADTGLLGHFRKRLNELINRDLRYTFGS